MSSISLNELKKIPFIDVDNLGGRFISSLTFYAENEWQMWTAANGQLVKMKAWPVEAFYFSAVEADKNDIYFHFLDFLAQRVSLPELQKPMMGLHDDFFNLSASLAKLDLLFRSKDDVEIKDGISRMVSTEIEYIISVCRGVFDLLQEIIAELWKSTELIDETINKKRLKETFREMVIHEQQPVTAEILTSKFGLPQQLADFYVRHTEFFLTLRKFRGNIIHLWSRGPLILFTEKGFAVHETAIPFSQFNIWTEEHKLENGLCSLRPAIGYTIHRTIGVCEDFSQTIEKIICFPPPIAPGLKLFMRGYFNAHLVSNIDAVNNCQ